MLNSLLAGRNKLPLTGFAMLHFDSHPDLCVSPDFTPDHLASAELMRSKVSIESWIMPLVAAGHLTHVVWVRPPWADQLADGEVRVKVGFANGFTDGAEKRFACSWATEYYTSDGTYARETDFDASAKELTITTSQVEKLKDDAITGKWFLDIDLDYYSVNDPFVEDLGGDELKKVSELFSTGEAPLDHCPIEQHEVYQRRKYDKLNKFNQHLDKWDAARAEFDIITELDHVDPDINELFGLWKAQRQLTKTAVAVAGEEDVLMSEGKLIFNAGCTTNSDGSGLPVHRTHRDEIIRMIAATTDAVNTTINAVGLPAGICFARSSLDGYCPPDQVEFIQSNLLASLESLFMSHSAQITVDKKY